MNDKLREQLELRLWSVCTPVQIRSLGNQLFVPLWDDDLETMVKDLVSRVIANDFLWNLIELLALMYPSLSWERYQLNEPMKITCKHCGSGYVLLKETHNSLQCADCYTIQSWPESAITPHSIVQLLRKGTRMEVRQLAEAMYDGKESNIEYYHVMDGYYTFHGMTTKLVSEALRRGENEYRRLLYRMDDYRSYSMVLARLNQMPDDHGRYGETINFKLKGLGTPETVCPKCGSPYVILQDYNEAYCGTCKTFWDVNLTDIPRYKIESILREDERYFNSLLAHFGSPRQDISSFLYNAIVAGYYEDVLSKMADDMALLMRVNRV